MNPPARPCSNCPWNPRARGFLHPDRAEDIADTARYGTDDFLCHKSVEHDEDGEHAPGAGDDNLCAGYAIAAIRDGVPGQLLRIQQRLSLAVAYPNDPEHELALDPDEMVEHHVRAWDRRRSGRAG